MAGAFCLCGYRQLWHWHFNPVRQPILIEYPDPPEHQFIFVIRVGVHAAPLITLSWVNVPSQSFFIGSSFFT